MRFWQRARHARNTAAAFILWSPAFVPAAATAVLTFIVADAHIEGIRKTAKGALELTETAIARTYDHLAHVHAEHMKAREMAAKGPSPNEPGPPPPPQAAYQPTPQHGVEPSPAPGIEKPVPKRASHKARRRASACTCPAKREGEWLNKPSYEPGFYGTAPDYREPYSFDGE